MVDPIMAWGMAPGYCIDPFVSVVQHSCTGNTSLIFEGNELRIRALRSIAKDEEILIPWLEFSKDVSTRAKRLLADWNLTCNCEACLKGTEDTNMRLRQLKVTCLRLVQLDYKESFLHLPEIEQAVRDMQSTGLDSGSHTMRHLLHRAIHGYISQNKGDKLINVLKSYLRIYYVVERNASPPTRRLERLTTLHVLCSFWHCRTPEDLATQGLSSYPDRVRVLLTNVYPH